MAYTHAHMDTGVDTHLSTAARLLALVIGNNGHLSHRQHARCGALRPRDRSFVIADFVRSCVSIARRLQALVQDSPSWIEYARQ